MNPINFIKRGGALGALRRRKRGRSLRKRYGRMHDGPLPHDEPRGEHEHHHRRRRRA